MYAPVSANQRMRSNSPNAFMLSCIGLICDSSWCSHCSGTSAIAQSYGTLTVPNIAFTKLAGSAFTAASSATTRTFADASFEFSVLSLTSNGAQIAFRSGQTIWKFASVAAG